VSGDSTQEDLAITAVGSIALHPQWLTGLQLDLLERTYGLASDQRCRQCGAPLQFATTTGAGSEYACSSDDASPIKNAIGGHAWRRRLDHYQNSRWTDRGLANAAVILLIQELRWWRAQAEEPEQEEPPVEGYDPGPEVDDMGGLSEVNPLDP
jgi:hypothetical protein